MSPRDVTTVVLGLVGVVLLGWATATEVRRRPGVGWTAQVAAGVTCGLLSALVVSALFVDLVPDDDEGWAWVGVVVLVVAVLVVVRSRPGHASRSRLSPGAERADANRQQSGP